MNLKARKLLGMTAVVALLSVAGPMTPKAMAQSALPSTSGWWYSGYLEAGGRFFLNNPEKSGIMAGGGRSLGKFYEYRDLRPGPFGNFLLSTGTNNGLYQFDLWGKNVGYDDQHYELNASKAGEHYFNFIWDETPHDYGTGHTLYNGIGSNTLTLPAGLPNQLGAVFCPNNANGWCTNPTAAKQYISQNLHDVDMGIRRDTAAVDWRWTPDSAWDIKAEYSNMHRTGTQTDGVVMSWSTRGVRVDAPKPVDDTTQNYALNGEYRGTSPWGQMFNFKLAYSGSTYTDGYDSYLVQNPFCATGATTCDVTSTPWAMMSLWPSNQQNGFSGTLGADLPMKSRYMGTVSYIMMRQNENFLPFTVNPNLGNDPVNGQPWNSTAALPAGSLNGAINTFLSNNVLTTQITSELKSKLSYRYYNFDNNTPEILVPQWIGADINVGPTSASYKPVSSLSISYTKQNAGAELNWRPDHRWNLGAAYGYERNHWTRADVDTTNENSGKFYVDYKPWVWLTARASWQYSARRYSNYNYLGRVGTFQWQTGSTTSNTLYSQAFRQFFLDNRDRNKARFSVSVDVLRDLTVTPTFGLQNDDYNLASTEVGMQRDHAWNGGVDVAYAMSPATKFAFSYMYEQRKQSESFTTASGTAAVTAANTWNAVVTDRVNTFTASVDQQLIPDQLSLRLGYATSYATISQPLTPAPTSNGGQYPDVKTVFQRFDATLKYDFAEDLVRRLGWQGKVVAKLGYAWERNSVNNYQIDVISPWFGDNANLCPRTSGGVTASSCGYMFWLANDNPNYNVQMMWASLTFKW